MYSQSVLAVTAVPLNNKTVKSYAAVSKKLDAIEKKYPEIIQRIDEAPIIDDAQLIRAIKSSLAYPEIKSILSSSVFRSLEEYLSVSERLMGSMYLIQIEHMPEGMDMASLHEAQKKSIQAMKVNGLPEDVIHSMQADLKDHLATYKKMQSASKKASTEDKNFVASNIKWIMSLFPGDGSSTGTGY